MAKKEKAAPKKREVSKSQEVKDYFATHSGAGPKEVSEALGKKGIDVTPAQVSNIKSKAGKEVITRLKNVGVNMRQPKRRPVAVGTLAGKTIVVTGTLESMSRQKAQGIIKSLGGKATNSVSSKTDLVVYGISPGSKLDKAKKLGVKTISEKEFTSLIK